MTSDSSLERRAEEVIEWLRHPENQESRLMQRAADLIEQLLSENRQVRERAEAAEARVRELGGSFCRVTGERQKDGFCPTHGGDNCLLQPEGAAQEIQRISAEREAYRTFIDGLMNWDGPDATLQDLARRILAENDR